MSDIAPDVAPAVEAPPAADPAPAPDPAPAEVDPFDSAEVQQFDRSYVEKLRKEAADRRTAHQPYAEAFGTYSAEEQAVWFDLAKELTANPKAAAEKFQQIAKEILGDPNAAPPPPAPDADKPLTQAELEAKFAERDQAQQLKEITAKIVSDATEMGYKVDTPEYRRLAFVAQYETGLDLKKADEMLKAERQAIIDGYVADKANGPRLPQNGGGAGAEATPIKSFSDASDALRAMLAAQ